MDNTTLIYILIAFGVSLALTMAALVDSLKKDFGSPQAKMIWHVIAMIPFIGWLIYYLFGAKKGKKQTLG